MKRLLIVLFIICTFFCGVYGQEKYNTFKLDTINIHGVVYDYSGKPAPGILLFIKGKAFPKPVYTNKDGEFELCGAEFKDSIIAETLNDIVLIKNNGSRFIQVEFPVVTIRNQAINDVQIIAKRKFPKKPTPEIKTLIKYVFPNYGHTAHFPGGENKFATSIKEKITYPQKAVDNNIEGDVEIGFIVDKDGSLNEFKVLRGIGYGCEEQVINALKTCPKWIPAIFAGQAVAIPSSITINFKLTDK